MNYQELFNTQLQNVDTRYFILDTKGSDSNHGDADFLQYRWQTNKFGKVRAGDLFLYRRPGKASETGKFYFFGAGEIGPINSFGEIEEKRVEAKILSPYPFKSHLHPCDLEDYQWDFKDRTPDSWEYFFNQYGMNQITKNDFCQIIALSEINQDEYDPIAATEALQLIQTGSYTVEDQVSVVKVRAQQASFSNQVKNNYENQCGICGINTRALLVGSHIIPWSKDKTCRLDPANGISLCVLHDKLFDTGFITFTDKLALVLSDQVKHDSTLSALLAPFDGKKLKVSRKNAPKKEYLDYHRKNIFK
ncbi:HNH endonuclease [Shewanella marina]|uniref:HNH endonuclease n=1 Tax=Shewanella marina TaxID=487319 RepID=UPI000471F3FD|nr:HNH endonuclease [Shewanella marina]